MSVAAAAVDDAMTEKAINSEVRTSCSLHHQDDGGVVYDFFFYGVAANLMFNMMHSPSTDRS